MPLSELVNCHRNPVTVIQQAEANGIRIVWQEPCFEAVPLRHFAGHTAHSLPTNQATQDAIFHQRPRYRKPMSRAELAKKIDREAVTRAARFEDDLMALLRCIGLTPPED